MSTEEKSIISRSGTVAELTTPEQLKPGQVGFCTDEKTIIRRRRLDDSRPGELDFFKTNGESNDLAVYVSITNPANANNTYRLFDYLYHGVGTVFLVTIANNTTSVKVVYMVYRNNLNQDATATLISQKGIAPELYISRADGNNQTFGLYLVKFGASGNWNIRISNLIGDTMPLAQNLALVPSDILPVKTIKSATTDQVDLKQTVFVGVCQKQFLTAADIELDCNGATGFFRIKTVKNGETISAANPLIFFTDGLGIAVKHEFYTPQSVEFSYSLGAWQFHISQSGILTATQVPWSEFGTIAALFRAYIDPSLTGDERAVVEIVEYHKNTISPDDHKWKHFEVGTIHLSGLDFIGNPLATGAPNSNGANTCVSISSGITIDENLEVNYLNTTDTNIKFGQDLGVQTAGILTSSNAAIFKATYNDAGGKLVKLPGTRFPFLWDVTTNRPEFVSFTGVRTLVNDDRFFVNFVYSFGDPRFGEGLKIRSSGAEYTTLANAQAATWEQLQTNSPTLRDPEIRPLYRLIFFVNSSGGNAYSDLCKYSVLREFTDIRKTKTISTITAAGSVLASNVILAPSGNIASTNVQSAIEELDAEKAPINSPTFTGNAIFENLIISKKTIYGILGDSIARQKSSCIFQIYTQMGWDISAENYAVDGSTIEQQATKIPSMKSAGVNVAMVQVGTNNINDAITTIYAKYESLITELKTNGISPIMFYIPQREQNKVANVWRINQILDAVCRKLNVPCFDAWSSFSGVLGGWISGESSDSVHPNQSTRTEAAAIVVSKISSNKSDRLLAFTNSDGLLLNPCFSLDTNADGLADSWSAVDTTYTTFSRIAKSNGKYAQRITATNNPISVHSTLRQFVSIVGGRKYRLQFKGLVSCSLDVASFNAYIKVNMIFGVTENIWGYTPLTGEFYCEMTVTAPPAETSLGVWIQIYSAGFTGVMTLDIEQVLLTDLTALSIP